MFNFYFNKNIHRIITIILLKYIVKINNIYLNAAITKLITGDRF